MSSRITVRTWSSSSLTIFGVKRQLTTLPVARRASGGSMNMTLGCSSIRGRHTGYVAARARRGSRSSVRREQQRMRGDELDVVPLGDDPEFTVLVPVHRVLGPQAPVCGVGVAQVERGIVEPFGQHLHVRSTLGRLLSDCHTASSPALTFLGKVQLDVHCISVPTRSVVFDRDVRSSGRVATARVALVGVVVAVLAVGGRRRRGREVGAAPPGVPGFDGKTIKVSGLVSASNFFDVPIGARPGSRGRTTPMSSGRA